MDQAMTVATHAGTTLVESGVLGCLVILQFAVIVFLIWQFVRALNKNTAAITKFSGILERLPCLDRNPGTPCEHDRKDSET